MSRRNDISDGAFLTDDGKLFHSDSSLPYLRYALCIECPSSFTAADTDAAVADVCRRVLKMLA